MDDLALVIARTGHQRYSELCDPLHPDYQPGMLATVGRLAAALRGETVPELSPLSSAPGPVSTAYVNLCVWRECDTGCKLTICRLGKGDIEDGLRTTGLHCLESCPHRQRPTE